MARPRAGKPADAFERLAGVEPPARVVEASRKRLERQLELEFRQAQTRRAETERSTEALMAQFRREGSEAERAATRLRELAARRAKQQPVLPGRVLDAEDRVSTGSVTVTRTPPFTWPWTWSATSGAPDAPVVRADANAGTMLVSLSSGIGGGGAASGAAALGIYFRPVTSVGILQLVANPALSWFWWTYDAFASSHSDAFVGLYVGAYTLGWSQYAVPVDQRISLWNESHSFLSSPDGQGSNTGYPLSAWTFVNGSSIYELWVWCGGSVSGAGDHTFYGSYGGANLNVRVPAITWTLY